APADGGAMSFFIATRLRTRRAIFCLRNLLNRALSPVLADIIHYPVDEEPAWNRHRMRRCAAPIRVDRIRGFWQRKLRGFWQRKKERRASAFFRFHPDPAPKAFHNLLADRQPDPASGPIVAVQPLEGFKDLKLILRRNTGTVIRAREKPHLALICNPDVDPWSC